MTRCRGALVAVLVLAAVGACSGDDGGSGETAASTTTTRSPRPTTTTTEAAGYEPVYDDGPCPAGVPADPRVTCGVLTVPEDREEPDGDVVRLAVVTVAGQGTPTPPDPILYLEGGPGFSGVDRVGQLLDADLGGPRDVITLSQRGTSGSEPNLNCPEVDEITILNSSAGDAPAAEAERNRAALLACHDRLVADGVDLGTYDTVTSAADVADLMTAMRHEEWNLFGVSYGTQLGLEVMRSHPDGIRAVVLDSVTPPHLASALDPISYVERLDRVLDLTAESCAADPDCDAAYPDPRADFEALIQKYEAAPFRGQVTNPLTGQPLPVTVTGQDIVGGAFQAYYDSGLIPLIPQLARQLLAGDTAIIPPLVERSLGEAVALAEAMELSVNCSDEAALFDENQPAALDDLVKERPLFEQFLGDDASICAEWDVPPAPAGFNDPVTSGLRTLVLAGEFDPVTPPEKSQSTSYHLTNDVYVEFPGLGHGEVFAHECPRSIFEAFINEPNAEIDTACVDEMGPPDWALPAP